MTYHACTIMYILYMYNMYVLQPIYIDIPRREQVGR